MPVSPIEQELKNNNDRIKRLRNQLPIHMHQVKQHQKEMNAYATRWKHDCLALFQAQAQQNSELFRLLTCGLSHRRIMQILRRLGC
jgi:hypothetical protein